MCVMFQDLPAGDGSVCDGSSGHQHADHDESGPLWPERILQPHAEIPSPG